MGVILPGRQGKAHVSRLFFLKLLFCQAQKKNVANLRARRVRNLKQSRIVFGANATAGRGNSYSRFTNPLSPLATTQASPAN